MRVPSTLRANSTQGKLDRIAPHRRQQITYDTSISHCNNSIQLLLDCNPGFQRTHSIDESWCIFTAHAEGNHLLSKRSRQRMSCIDSIILVLLEPSRKTLPSLSYIYGEKNPSEDAGQFSIGNS